MVHITATDVAPSENLWAAAPNTLAMVGGEPTFSVHDETALDAWIASTAVPSAEGLTTAFAVSAENPGGPNSTVRLTYTDRDSTDAVLAYGVGADVTITSTPQELTLTLPAASPGTTYRRISVVNRDTPPATAIRSNDYLNPRLNSAGWTTGIITRFPGNWATDWASEVGAPGGGYRRARCTTAETGTQRGTNLGGSVSSASPVTAQSLPVTASATYTVSAHLRSNRANVGHQVAVRYHDGTNWIGAAVLSAASDVATNTWSRVSVTSTAPTGALYMHITAWAATSIAWAVNDNLDVAAVLLETAPALGAWFDGNYSPNSLTPAWLETAHASTSVLRDLTLSGRKIVLIDPRITVSAAAEELIGAALERDYRRHVADIWNAAPALITAGTPAALTGRLTYLCSTLTQAMRLDSVYQLPGLIVLTSTDELNGLTHRAVGRARIDPERALPGKPARWLLAVEFREQAE